MKFFDLRIVLVIMLAFAYTATAAFYPVNRGMVNQGTIVTTAAGTTTFAATGNQVYIFEGSTTQTAQFPSATSLPLDWWYDLVNNSTGSVTVKDGGGATIKTLAEGESSKFQMSARASSAGTWKLWPSLATSQVFKKSDFISSTTGVPDAGKPIKTTNFGVLDTTFLPASASLTAALNVFTSTLQGVVPASGGGGANFLRADGIWTIPSSSAGTVTSLSVASANGFTGTVANPTSTPVITIATSITGITKGDGTALSAATAGVDYENPLTFSSPLARTVNTVTMGAATSSNNGYLTSADWLTFNGKQASGSYVTSLTSDVTASGPGAAVATIANNAVTNAKAAQMAAHTFKGNNTAGTANSIDLTQAQLTADLNLFSSTLQGLTPLSGGGTTNFLRADGTWAVAGVGTITSVAATAPSILSVSGSPITSGAGTLAFSLANQAANTIFSGPTSGGAATPTFRSLVGQDMPAFSGDVTTSAGVAATFLATVNSNVGSFTNSSITVNAKGLITAASSGAASGAAATTQSIAQASHGFSVGNWLYYTGTVYALANAAADSTAEVLGVVSAVADANNFTLLNVGQVTGLSALTAGSTYWLSDTVAGAITSVATVVNNHVNKPVFVAYSTTAGYVIQSRGIVVGSVANLPFTSITGVATVAQTTVSNQALTTCTTARTVDWSTGNSFTLTLTSGNACTLTFSNPTSGQTINLWLTNGSAGGTATVVWPTAKWFPAGAPVMSTGTAALDVCTCTYNGTSYACNCLKNGG